VRAPCFPHLCCLLLAVLACAGCGEEDVDLQVLVDRDTNATFGEVAALRIGVRTACSNMPTYFEPYVLGDDTLQQHQPTTVPANTPFSVDVWGCAALEGCERTPIARGCNVLPDGVPENSETPAIISVLLRDLDDMTQSCPIEPPCPGG
jgi:hypothetical protein